MWIVAGRMPSGNTTRSLRTMSNPPPQSAFARAGMIDRLCLIVAPQTLGARGVPWLDPEALPHSALSWMTAEPAGVDLWIEADGHVHC